MEDFWRLLFRNKAPNSLGAIRFRVIVKYHCNKQDIDAIRNSKVEVSVI